MTGFFYEMEKVIKQNSDRALELALFYYGQTLKLYRSTKNDVYSRVHGKEAGGPLSEIMVFDGVLQSDDFSTSDGYNTANFEEGFLFTKEKDNILVGDIIKVDAGGGVREFRVEAKEDIGYSTDMFVKFRLSNRN